jgi:glyoxylase-like metal-dependent hydrolase (beta-lactamase superfamily II)
MGDGLRDDLPVADEWFAVDALDSGVYRVREPHCHRLVRANVFLVKGRDRDLLVDTGMGVASLRAALDGLIDKPLTLVTTHAHVDHRGAHHEFADGEILVHPAEAAALAQPTGRGLGFSQFDEVTRRLLAEAGFDTSGLLIDALPWAGYDPLVYERPGVIGARPVGDGAVIDLGARAFRVLHLPGHSPGSIGLFEAETGILFSGDAVYDGILVDTLPGCDIGDYRRTMERLLSMDVRTVHGGHNDELSQPRFRAIADDYLRRRSAWAPRRCANSHGAATGGGLSPPGTPGGAR